MKTTIILDTLMVRVKPGETDSDDIGIAVSDVTNPIRIESELPTALDELRDIIESRLCAELYDVARRLRKTDPDDATRDEALAKASSIETLLALWEDNA